MNEKDKKLIELTEKITQGIRDSIDVIVGKAGFDATKLSYTDLTHVIICKELAKLQLEIEDLRQENLQLYQFIRRKNGPTKLPDNNH